MNPFDLAARTVDPSCELMRWGPLNAYLFYTSESSASFFSEYPKAFKVSSCPSTLQLMRQGRFLWLNDFSMIRKNGRNVFMEYVLPQDKREELYATWKENVALLEKIQHELDVTRLDSLSDEEFAARWDVFYAAVIAFWIPTIPAEIGNYGSDRYLEEELRSHVPAEKLAEVLEILTAPENPSFYQEEEIDLVEMGDIAEHQRKYTWLKNSYAGVEVIPLEFFTERKKELPADFRAQTEQRFTEMRRRKAEIIERFSLPESVVQIADALRIGIERQDERKKYIFQTIHYKDMLLREAARRFGYSYEVLLSYDYREVRELCFGKKFESGYEVRSLGCLESQVMQPDGTFVETIQTLTPEEIEKLWNTYTREEVSDELTEFKGIVACVGDGGVVRGHVKVLLDPRQSSDFKPGDILVTTMTTPEYVFVMKEASAILTDTGGLTSHAAIVARELNKPCVIGTKIATKVLKDGDEVEVDATKGIVRIITKK